MSRRTRDLLLDHNGLRDRKYCSSFWGKNGGSYIGINSLFPRHLAGKSTGESYVPHSTWTWLNFAPDVNSELSIFTRVWRARESSVDSREGIIYRVKGEREEGSARLLAPSAMYYLVPGTMGFVCKSFETRNQAERPPTSRASCSGSSKGPEKCRGMQNRGRRIERRGARNFACGASGAAVYRSKAEGQKETRENARGEETAESSETLLHNATVLRVAQRRGK